MPFLFKQPSVLPHVLSTSQCPPHDVLHDVTEYPLYYDPLNFPADHTMLFESEQSVCQWLWHDLVIHRVGCSQCFQATSPFNEMISRVCFSFNFFEVEFHQLHFRVPLSYIKSSNFSFCGLYSIVVSLHSEILIIHLY